MAISRRFLRRVGSQILTGILVGVFSGAILSGSHFAIKRIDDRLERQDQVRYFATLFAEYREWIYAAEPEPTPYGYTIRRQAVRTYRYEAMKRHMKSALDGRASQLAFDERHDLELVCRIGDVYPRWLDDAQIDAVFNHLESIHWLGLTPRTD